MFVSYADSSIPGITKIKKLSAINKHNFSSKNHSSSTSTKKANVSRLLGGYICVLNFQTNKVYSDNNALYINFLGIKSKKNNLIYTYFVLLLTFHALVVH